MKKIWVEQLGMKVFLVKKQEFQNNENSGIRIPESGQAPTFAGMTLPCNHPHSFVIAAKAGALPLFRSFCWWLFSWHKTGIIKSWSIFRYLCLCPQGKP